MDGGLASVDGEVSAMDGRLASIDGEANFPEKRACGTRPEA
jgi:hypothetical protein